MVTSMGLKRHRTVGEKLEILAAYEEAARGTRGEVLRRFGTSRANLARWAFARDNGEFGPGPTGVRVAGARMTPRNQSEEIVRLRRELAKAQADQAVLSAALESLGKAHALLEKVAESAEPDALQRPSVKKPSPPSSPTD